jgi:hypothetical protein
VQKRPQKPTAKQAALRQARTPVTAPPRFLPPHEDPQVQAALQQARQRWAEKDAIDLAASGVLDEVAYEMAGLGEAVLDEADVADALAELDDPPDDPPQLDRAGAIALLTERGIFSCDYDEDCNGESTYECVVREAMTGACGCGCGLGHSWSESY